VLRTDRDWIADVVRFAVARKRQWSDAPGALPISGGRPAALR
jgi:hypothetical protein